MRFYTICTLVLSIFWISIALGFVFIIIGWDNFKQMKANELGDFFAGLAAPLAFFWFVAGYFGQTKELSLQRNELSLQRKETKRLAAEAERQNSIIEKTEMLNRVSVFVTLQENFKSELISITYQIARTHGHVSNILKNAKELSLPSNEALIVSVISNIGKEIFGNKPEVALQRLKTQQDDSPAILTMSMYQEIYSDFVDVVESINVDYHLKNHMSMSLLGKLDTAINVYFKCIDMAKSGQSIEEIRNEPSVRTSQFIVYQ